MKYTIVTVSESFVVNSSSSVILLQVVCIVVMETSETKEKKRVRISNEWISKTYQYTDIICRSSSSLLVS